MPTPTITFIAHPGDTFRVGDFLRQNLSSPQWTHFHACIAFVKRSGVAHVQEVLESFSEDRDVRISVGLDHGVTSMEGLIDLKKALGGRGQLFVFKNANSSTFHPKAYLFRNDEKADVVMGSSNLTEGGLYTNYECSLRVQLTLSKRPQRAVFESVQKRLNEWSTATPGLCLEVTDELIQQLHAAGDLPSEAQIRERERKTRQNEKRAGNAPASPFQSHPVPSAPTIAANGGLTSTGASTSSNTVTGRQRRRTSPASPAASQVAPIASATNASATRTFGMTLQNTDVGVGRVTSGVSGRSPEVFIPIAALDLEPTFWGWRNRTTPGPQYVSDAPWAATHAPALARKRASNRSGRPLEKLDWKDASIGLAGHPTLSADIWYNPLKVDIRFRHGALRAAGDIDDIMLIRQAPANSGRDYDVEIVKKGDPSYPYTLARLTTSIRNSKKKIGFF